MKFTVIGHAGLFVEAGDTSLLVDPWLSGSCYWRSWWHDPPIGEPDPAWLAPRFVYLTHHHFDHFHYPSMRRIDRSTEVLVPRFGVDVMVDELHELGFANVRELPHGHVVELGDGLRAASYQYGFDDTALVVASGDDVVANLNDCKIRGLPLRQIVSDFGRPTFMLKTHSWAQAYPNCYRAEDPADLGRLTPETYIADFVEIADQLRPRYAVPFANMVGFLHPESELLNDHLITPGDVADAFDRAGPADSELVPMGPGDHWEAATGFSGPGVDPFTDRRDRLERRRREVAPLITRQDEIEESTDLEWDGFHSYFDQFVCDVPWFARRLVRQPVVFEIPSAPESPWWVVDARRRRVFRSAEPPDDRASTVQVREGVLADAIDKRIVHFLHVSMRIRVELRKGATSSDLGFWALMNVWEIGYLPLRRLARVRFAATLLRRWREMVDVVRVLVRGRGSPIDRLSSGFATQDAVTPTTRQ